MSSLDGAPSMRATGSALSFMETSPAAFRSVQPFRIHEKAILLGVEVTDTYEQEYCWSELYRLTQLEPRQASPARPHGLVAGASSTG